MRISPLIVLAPTPPRFALAATALRLASGGILVGFGVSKFIHHARETVSFGKYGLPDPSAFVYLIGLVELGFGALLVLGLVSRLAALSLAGDMIGAIATGGRVDGGFINLGLAPILLVAMLVLVWAGGGRWSLDERLARSPLVKRLAYSLDLGTNPQGGL